MDVSRPDGPRGPDVIYSEALAGWYFTSFCPGPDGTVQVYMTETSQRAGATAWRPRSSSEAT